MESVIRDLSDLNINEDTIINESNDLVLSEEEEPYSIYDLPSELYMLIASQCVTHRETSAMKCTCKFLRDNFGSYMNMIALGKFTLNKYQKKYYKLVLESDIKETNIKMPMSSGKTALGIALAIRHTGPAIIVVPSSILDHWINEFDNIFPDKEKRNFNLYVVHKSKHKKSYNKLFSDNRDRLNSNDIIICSSHTSDIWTRVQFINNINNTRTLVDGRLVQLLKKINNDNLITILDEIHIKNVTVRYKELLPYSKKIVTLSADNNKVYNDTEDTTNIIVDDSVIEDCIPNYEMTNVIITNNIPKKILNICKKNNIPNVLMNMLYAIQKKILSTDGKTMIFIPGNNILSYHLYKENTALLGDKLLYLNNLKGLNSNGYMPEHRYNKLNFMHIFEYYMDLCGHKDYKYIYYNNMKSLNKFDDINQSKCVLFATPTKIQVGININNISNVIFMFTPYKFYNNTVYSQCIGRFRRVNNTNKIIKIHNLIYPLDLISDDYVLKVPKYIDCKLEIISKKYFEHIYNKHKSTIKKRGYIISSFSSRNISYNSIYSKLPGIKYNESYEHYVDSNKHTGTPLSRILNLKQKYLYNLSSYVKLSIVDKKIKDNFIDYTKMKILTLCEWLYPDINPLDLSDEEYLYLTYIKKRTSRSKYSAIGKEWFSKVKPNSKY